MLLISSGEILVRDADWARVVFPEAHEHGASKSPPGPAEPQPKRMEDGGWRIVNRVWRIEDT
jgi:hypothetical protein